MHIKKGDKENPCNYRGITRLSVVRNVFCKVFNNRLVSIFTRVEYCMKVKQVSG